MRMIGQLNDETQARIFGDYLYVQGIDNEIDRENVNAFAVWIHSDDDLARAEEMLVRFRENPNHPDYRAGEAAREKRLRAQEENEAAQKRTFNRDQIIRTGIAPLTMSLMIVSVGMFVVLYFKLEQYQKFVEAFFISLRDGRDLPEVRNGEVWRLVTPIFLHFGVLHILFNMLWLKDLGTILERRHSTLALGVLVLTIGVISNLAQYWFKGPAFGGMSGVVYGLFGYLWLRGRVDPNWTLHLHNSTVAMMLIWLLVCLTGAVGNIANHAHFVGFGVGCLWAVLATYGVGGKLLK
ncbi:MAG: rhomboid family intramembrane serine protease [Verrucomicrobiota bacterium]